MLHAEIRDQNDALSLLFDAAEYVTDSRDQDGLSTHVGGVMNAEQGPSPSVMSTPAMDEWVISRHPLSHPSVETVEAWQICPFVKDKWMTAEEAVTYVDLFFRNLAPMSTILDDYFADHQHHRELIMNEQTLCCTFLALSSRYHFLTGVASLSRGFILHERLWEHCHSMLQRAMSEIHPNSVGRRNTLSIIESILILTEWHPRSFLSSHFWTRSFSMDWPGDETVPEKSSKPSL
jgi:hypothetical protein